MTISTEQFQIDKNQSCFSQKSVTSDSKASLSNNSVQISHCTEIIIQFISNITKPERNSRDNLFTLVFSCEKVAESLRSLIVYSTFKDLCLIAC